MKTLLIITSFLCLLTGYAQQEPETDYKALEASRELTWEADKELESEDFVNAEATYRRAIAKSAENPVAPYNLGNAYYEKESFGEAFGRYREAGERAGEKPRKHQAYHNMGNVYMQQKEYEKAVEAYKEALRNNPADEETRYNLALAKEMMKKDPQDQSQNEDQDEQNEQQDQDQEKEQNQDQNQDQDQGGEDEQQDQDPNQQEGDSEKEENKEGDGPEKQEQDQKPDPSRQEDQKTPPRPNQLSPQQIENLLEAMENEEKKVKEKIDAQKVKGPKVKKEKDW